MTESTPLAKAAADALSSAAMVARVPNNDTTDRELEAIRHELSRTRRRLAWRSRAWAFGAAAAVVVAVLGARRLEREPAIIASKTTRIHSAHGEVSVHRGATLASGDTAQSGDVVVCRGPECRADLVLPSGSLAALQGDTRIALSSTGEVQLLGLDAGSARFDVVKLRASERFIVKTVDAEIEVRGTSFRVTVGDESCGSGRTRVEVFEGIVAVRHGSSEELLVAGQRWPAAPRTSAPAASSVTSVPAIATSASSASSISPVTPPATKSGVASTSDLSAHNALWAEAVAAKKRGDNAAALAGFTKYLAKYPNGFLAEAAEVERMRLLSGPARVEAAKSYLAKHPNGYARAEATAVVERGTP